MYKAIMIYTSGDIHFVVAGTLAQLKDKCKPFIENPEVTTIEVEKFSLIGCFKHPFAETLKGGI